MTNQNNQAAYFENGVLDEHHMHRYCLRVHYADTDAGGVVYHARYLEFCERARGGWLRCVGLPDVFEEDGQKLFWVLRHASLDYKKPGRLGDIITIETKVTDMGLASFMAHQAVKCDDLVLCAVDLKLALMNEQGRPQRISSKIRHKFSVNHD